jgi:hypothetical protein
MKIARLSVLLICALAGLAVPALPAKELSVGIAISGRADATLRDANFQIIGRPSDSFNFNPPVEIDLEGIETSLEASRTAVAGSAIAEAHARAIANAGSIGAGITIGASGEDIDDEPAFFPKLIDAVGIVNLATATASFKETLIARPAPGVPNGLPVRIPAFLFVDIEGSFGVTASGRLSQGQATFQLKDVDGGTKTLPDAPYSLTSQCPANNCWGFIQRNISAYTAPPTDVDIRLEPPVGEGGGTVRVEVHATVGQEFTLGYQISVSGNASSGDGAVVVSADFSHTLKWGGIEGIFNRNTGERIEGLTIVSESGFDYTRSFDAQVPEPACIALMMAASCFWPRRTRARL